MGTFRKNDDQAYLLKIIIFCYLWNGRRVKFEKELRVQQLFPYRLFPELFYFYFWTPLKTLNEEVIAAISHLISIFESNKEREGDQNLWGDEIEYCFVDQYNGRSKVSLAWFWNRDFYINYFYSKVFSYP